MCVANQQLLFWQDFLVPKGPKLIAVGKRFARSPRELNRKGDDPERVKQSARFDPFRVGRCNRLFRGLRAKPLTHGY